MRWPPSGPDWLHEIKHDGYRIMAAKQGDAVRLWSRAGKDWTDLLPGIRDAIRGLDTAEVILDGEAVAHGAEGHQDFHGLRSRMGRKHAVMFAFDLLALDGEDLRRLPLIERKAKLERLLGRSPPVMGIPIADYRDDHIRFVEHLDADGALVFKHACALGLEGIVSKHKESPYPHGPTRNWLKTKNSAYRRKSFRR